MTDDPVTLGPCAECGGYHGGWEAHSPPPASRQELGELEAVLHLAPDYVWRSVSGMRDYLLRHGVRVAVKYEPR